MSNRREMVGVGLVALTASTILTMFLIGERAEHPVDILENAFPPQIRHDLRNTFSFATIARKPVEQLVVQVSCLNRFDLKDMGINVTKKGREGMMSIRMISDLSTMAGKAGLDPVEFEVKRVERNRTEYSMYVIDFTDVLRPVVDPRVLAGYAGAGLSTVYAALFNETGLAYLYGGSRDFFNNRNGSISELSIAYNDDKEVYKRMKELSPSEIASGVPSLLDAPAMGTLVYDQLKRDDTLRLAFSVDRSTVGGYDAQLRIHYEDKLQLVRVIVNGEDQTNLANFCLA